MNDYKDKFKVILFHFDQLVIYYHIMSYETWSLDWLHNLTK